MPLHDGFKEFCLGGGDVEDCLSRFRLGEEDHEIDGVPELKGNADFRFLFKAADARPVARAGVDDDEGTPCVIDLHTCRRDDPDQGIVDGTLEGPSIGDDLPLEGQKRGGAFLYVLDVVVAALAQDIPEEHRSLRKVGRVGGPCLPRIIGDGSLDGLLIHGGLLHVAEKILLGLERADHVETTDLSHEIEKIRCFILPIFHG